MATSQAHGRGGSQSCFPEQGEITAFLRTLLTPDMTQVALAERAGVPYNTLTNWFTEKPSRMSAESLLRVVIAAGAENRLRDWLRAGRQVPGLKLHEIPALPKTAMTPIAAESGKKKHRAAGKQ